ncbi:tumor-associated calcium signal transducer 2 [Zootoca vivipara]|uniref:tumor-associated calcium signal transducer 2 n=1 Tax=Zootoca vivipara TaxID=8524 RepID=UPI00293C120C|nr:tumor-associated calcium signal transducer 2 [Zootoca vivipara]
MESAFGAALVLMLVAASAAQNDCFCPTFNRASCSLESGSCICTAGSLNQRLDCSTLIPKCLLLKSEIKARKGRKFSRPEHGFMDNDGLYNPECDAMGFFKARQCNQTESGTCWCVNSAGVRRTDKGDLDMRCNELVRTSWIYIEMKHKERKTPLSESEVANSFRQFIENRYLLHPKFITAVEYKDPLIHIDLKQNISDKSYRDVDIADVAYYFERDIQGKTFFPSNNMFDLYVNDEPLAIEDILVYYVDDKPPEFSMQRLTAGIIAVVVVLVLAIVIGITVLVVTRRRKTGKYEKVEIKEMGDMRRGQHS